MTEVGNGQIRMEREITLFEECTLIEEVEQKLRRTFLERGYEEITDSLQLNFMMFFHFKTGR